MPIDAEPYDVAFASGEVTLAGALAVPEGDGPRPGVVLVGGSGPSDRHNDTFFPPIRRHLVDSGVAVLSYDKRGVGASSGDWLASTMDDLAADADAALRFLRTRPGVRSDAVGLFGHSEGGWVVLRAAAGRDDVAWVVTNSGPGTTPAVQDRHALLTAVRRDGSATRAEVDAAAETYDRVMAVGRRGGSFAEACAVVEAAEVPAAFTDFWADVDERLWRFRARKQDHDPIPDVCRLRCPHLAVFGAADELVPVADSLALFGRAACRPGRDRRASLTVEVFPGADHRLGTAAGLAPGYLDALARWIGARTGSRTSA
ncbi:alpha/beta hydrolase family protein [Actinocatenispora rupis]|uniref:Serine aminopeptidase S33 domain-containing protein n=1 Tax=Actinocatenispora rupis TaxID=519421 RepID=A0A8J3NEA4_9ACTN|nr:alpha/beta hydrolase [Actinocatenispora rupis]GID16174.1 hypothetical protein Aru02nite_70630 [Actinocatenispora rupis]